MYSVAVKKIKERPKPSRIVTRLQTFSRASRKIHEFASSYDWFSVLSMSFVIGQRDYR